MSVSKDDGNRAGRWGTSGAERRWEIAIVALLLLYFAGRLFFFAGRIAPNLPPDESTHVGISLLYAEAPLHIEDSPESYHLGLVTRQPWLFHFVMGKALHLNVFGIDSYLFLRYLNVLMALLTVVVAYRLAMDLIEDGIARVLGMVMITNTLGFTFIGAAVNYDNLVNVFAVLGVWCFVRFVSGRGVVWLSGMILCCLLGALTKVTIAPLVVILVLLVIVDRRGALLEDVAEWGRALRHGNAATVMTSAGVILALAGCLTLYGVNLVRYRKPVPGCSQVLAIESCMENRIFARNRLVNQFKDGGLTFDQALRATAQIPHQGDRDHAIRLLRNELAYRQQKPETIPRYEYVFLVWNQAMKPTIYGVQAHLSMLRDPGSLVPLNLVLFAALLLWARGIRWDDEGRVWVHLSVLVGFYFLFLIAYVNYGFYIASHAPLLGVQGRYLFPILVPAYLVIGRYVGVWKNRLVAVAVLIVISAVFIAGDFPWFLKHATDAWFVGG